MNAPQSPAPVAGAVEAHIQALVDLAKREASHLFDVAPDAEDMAHLSRAIENLATFARALAALHPQPAPAGCKEQCWACAESGIGCNLLNDGQPAPAVAVEAHRLAEEAKTAWGRQDPRRLWNAIEALERLAATPAVAESQWRTIESAPKDGTTVYLHQAGRVFEGSWLDIPFIEYRDAEGCFVDQQDSEAYWMDHESGDMLDPTEWMPKTPPAPPTIGSGSAQEGQAK